MKPILVTRATRNVGLGVVRELLQAGATVRARVTDLEKARQVLGDGPQYTRLDFTDPVTQGAALEGVEQVFAGNGSSPGTCEGAAWSGSSFW